MHQLEQNIFLAFLTFKEFPFILGESKKWIFPTFLGGFCCAYFCDVVVFFKQDQLEKGGECEQNDG